MSHNRGKFKSELGHCRTRIERKCETCGTAFTAEVRKIEAGAGRFCWKRCNPVYWPNEPPTMKHRRHNLKRNYGMTQSDYEAMVAAQNGECAICRRLPSGRGRYARLVIDHDHETGAVRGLLCNKCNAAIGMLRDCVEVVQRAVAYLSAHKHTA